jgi:TolB-like protein
LVAFAFGEHVLDVDRRELRRGGAPVALEPQVFDLLVYLIRNCGRVVSKDDLIEAIWGGRIVSESAVTTGLNAARKAIGDTGAAQQVIRTIPRKGVRFIAEVREDGASVRGERAAGTAETMPLALPDKPSIAVLPFANMSSDPEQEFFADGIAEDIITALSRYPSLFVIARNSCFTYKGRAVDVKQVGRELGVRYVLEGSLRKSGNRIRVTAQLVEARTGNHAWAERYDRDRPGHRGRRAAARDAATAGQPGCLGRLSARAVAPGQRQRRRQYPGAGLLS